MKKCLIFASGFFFGSSVVSAFSREWLFAATQLMFSVACGIQWVSYGNK